MPVVLSREGRADIRVLKKVYISFFEPETIHISAAQRAF
jgi:hypothetical protein